MTQHYKFRLLPRSTMRFRSIVRIAGVLQEGFAINITGTSVKTISVDLEELLASIDPGSGGALDPDLIAIGALTGTGFPVRVADNTWLMRSIVGPQSVVVVNGDGVAGNVSLALVNDTASPGANKVYGTDGAGAKGWKADPAGGGSGITDGDKGDITVSGSGAAWTIDNDVVTYAKMQNVSAASKLLGRGDSGAGDPQEITLGTNLVMSGTTLSATSSIASYRAQYIFNPTVGGAPVSGRFRLNNASQTAATVIHIHEIGDDSIDHALGIASLVAGDLLFIRDKGNSALNIYYRVTAAGTDQGAYWTVPVVYESGPAGILAQACLINIVSGNAVGVTDGDKGDITVSGSGAAWTIDNDVVTYAKMQNVSAASKLLGRGSAAGAGDPEEIILGTNLSMSGTTLNATGGGGSSGVTISDTPPGSPTDGQLWWESDTGRLYVRYNDGSSTQWCGVVGASGSALTRELLIANRTYYVRTDGNNSNSGLVDSAGGAFLTIQKAIDVIAALDLATFTATVQVRDGTYTTPIVLKNFIGVAGNAIIQGNAATPANVIVSVTDSHAILNDAGFVWTLKDFEIRTAFASVINGHCLLVRNGAGIYFSNLRFGSCVGYHMYVQPNSMITAIGSYAITGNAQFHAAANGYLNLSYVIAGITVTYSNSPTFSAANILAGRGGVVDIYTVTFVNGGTVTGKRYLATSNGVIFTSGSGATFIPGTIAGTTDTGGQYL